MLSIGCAASGPGSAAEIYRYVDSKGRVHLTDRPPHDGYQLIQKAGKKLRMPRINFRNKDANSIRRDPEYLDIVDQIWSSLRNYVE